MKTLELSEGELALLSALFTAEGLNIPIRAAAVAAGLQGKLAVLAGNIPNGPRLVPDEVA